MLKCYIYIDSHSDEEYVFWDQVDPYSVPPDMRESIRTASNWQRWTISWFAYGMHRFSEIAYHSWVYQQQPQS